MVKMPVALVPPVLLLSLCCLSLSTADVLCPRLPSGVELRCGEACCHSYEGNHQQGYYCCAPDDKNVVAAVYRDPVVVHHPTGAVRPAERYTAALYPSIQFDYTLLLAGLIISIVLSVLLSFFCCLLCNGCWLHRRRNPHMYENVGDREEAAGGFYPICCGFGIPMGTVMFSTHPPQFREDQYYAGGRDGSSLSAASRSRVRFNEDGTPKGVLKNGNGNEGFH